jgi:hypothetical protein
MELDTSKWSGEGEFTARLIECLRTIEGISYLRVEDAPASRSDADYNFISNELFVSFADRPRRQGVRRFWVWPARDAASEQALTIAGLEQALAAIPDVGPPDYSDDGMLQYLRTERIIPPYQTRGYKLVELVRLYEAAGAHRA